MNKNIVAVVIVVSFMMVLSIGTVVASNGNGNGGGFDQYGYNYQARLFNGWYGNYLKPTTPLEYGTWNAWVVMKWSKNWVPMQNRIDDKSHTIAY